MPTRPFFALVCMILAIPANAVVSTPARAADTARARTTISFEPLKNHGAPIVEVHFAEGVVGHFMIDTGASLCCMTDTFAQKLHLKPYQAGFGGNALYMGSDHGRQSEAVDVKALDLGTLTLTGVSFVLIKKTEFFRFGETVVDGLIGENVFRQAAMLIDYPNNSLTLLLPGGLSDAEVAELGMASAQSVPLRHNSRRFGPDSMELFTDLTLTNGARTAKDELIVDTGAPDTSISQTAAEALGLNAVARRGASTMGDGSYFGSIGIVPEVKVGDLTVTDLQVSYPGRARVSDIPPLLGEDVLGYCRTLFDMPRNRLYLKPVLPPVNAAAATMPLQASHADFTRLSTLAGDIPVPAFQLDPSDLHPMRDDDEGLGVRATRTDRIAALRLALKGDDFADARTYDHLGDALWASGDHPAALENYEKSIALYRTLAAAKPGDGSLLALLAISLNDAGHDDEAETVARRAIALAPNDPEAQDALGWALFTHALRKLTGGSRTVEVSTEHLTEFDDLVKRLRAHPPSAAEQAAVEAWQREAAACFDRGIAVAPKAYRAYEGRAVFRRESGLGITATLRALHGETVDALAEANPTDAMDDLARAADQIPENIGFLLRVAEQAADAPIVRNERGIDLREGKTWESLPSHARSQAQKQIDRLLAIAHGDDAHRAARAWEALGYLDLNVVENRDRAASDLKSALLSDPDSTFAAYEFASLMRDDRRYDEIVTLLQPLVAAHDSATARLSLAYADTKQEHWSEALANADAALALNPASYSANLTVALLNLQAIATDTSKRLKRAESCLDAAQKALDGKPSEGRVAEFRHARALFDAMNLAPDKARTNLLEVLHGNRSDTRAREILAALLNL